MSGAAVATTKALPQYAGKFDGAAVRVPVAIGSLVDLVFLTSRRTTVEEVNSIFIEEADSDRYRGVLGGEHGLREPEAVLDSRGAAVSFSIRRWGSCAGFRPIRRIIGR